MEVMRRKRSSQHLMRIILQLKISRKIKNFVKVKSRRQMRNQHQWRIQKTEMKRIRRTKKIPQCHQMKVNAKIHVAKNHETYFLSLSISFFFTQIKILGRSWFRHRLPPRGFTSESYALCQNFHENGVCNFGLNCVNAHSLEELQEWKERFELRKQQHENSIKQQHGKSYTEDLLERLHQSTNPEKIMKEKLDGVDVTCSNGLNLTVSSKTCKREWIFVLKTTKLLKAVALLQDEHRAHFGIKHVFPVHPGKQSSSTIQSDISKNDQEWTFEQSRDSLDTENETVVSHRVKIGFSTDIYGEWNLRWKKPIRVITKSIWWSALCNLTQMHSFMLKIDELFYFHVSSKKIIFCICWINFFKKHLCDVN